MVFVGMVGGDGGSEDLGMVRNDAEVYTSLFVWSVSYSWKCCVDVVG